LSAPLRSPGPTPHLFHFIQFIVLAQSGFSLSAPLRSPGPTPHLLNKYILFLFSHKIYIMKDKFIHYYKQK